MFTMAEKKCWSYSCLAALILIPILLLGDNDDVAHARQLHRADVERWLVVSHDSITEELKEEMPNWGPKKLPSWIVNPKGEWYIIPNMYRERFAAFDEGEEIHMTDFPRALIAGKWKQPVSAEMWSLGGFWQSRQKKYGDRVFIDYEKVIGFYIIK
jgi:hypothetical protein